MGQFRRIAFLIPRKENERRRALAPEHLPQLRNISRMFFETGYFATMGLVDEDVIRAGGHVLPREELLQLEVVCNPKAAEPEEFDCFTGRNTLFGWIHAVQDSQMTDFLVRKCMTAIAWEDMFEQGRHVFWRNNELAGEAAVIHACSLTGRSPSRMLVAVLGRGHTAHGALRILWGLGATVHIYGRREVTSFQSKLGQYDAVVNCVLWDVFTAGRILYRRDLARMKPGSLIIDISCNHSMEIESCHPTSIEDPIYVDNNVLHYCVDHTPSLLSYDATKAIGEAVIPYLDLLAEGREGESETLHHARIISEGQICDSRIKRFQTRSECPLTDARVPPRR